MWRIWARSHRTRSISRRPPPNVAQLFGSARRTRRQIGLAVERGVKNRGAGGGARNEALACRLMNMSALLLLAIAARPSSDTLWSSSRVRRTRMPSRLSIAALTRRATASVEILLLRAAGAFHPVVLAAVSGIDRNGPERSDRCAERRQIGRDGWRGSRRGRRRRTGRRLRIGLAPPSARSSFASSCRALSVVARNVANRGPRSTISVAGSITRIACNNACG